MRARYCWTSAWQVRRRAASAASTCAMVVSSMRNAPGAAARGLAAGVWVAATTGRHASAKTTAAVTRRTLLLQLGVDLRDVVLHAAHVVVLELVRHLERRDRIVRALAGLHRRLGRIEERLVE